ncbi:ComEC/Rec2 family competence protein [Hyphococcus flavus]|uniref:ComEC/Rec2 family competence protein n=1 Tax=Hyphococcus flavus TaxID=1866326 RepID=A0AAE9ZEF3_9PROT|nr:ComEC/Rec2 family competence protein [Hyphococcus flavus]WDI31097.1 ComEC/Rec2 family competence protein [Hyphococcus flavus]
MTAETFGEIADYPSKSRMRSAPSLRRALFLIGKNAAVWAKADLSRITLWSPVAIALGVGLYFSLKSEPGWQVGVTFLFVSLLIAFRIARLRLIASAFALAALGFVAADCRTYQVAAPQLWRDIGIVEATGRLVSVEESEARRRYVIALHSIAGLAPEDTPARARITWRGEGFDAAPGDVISIRAGLSPPPPPVAPGAFDYARQLYFQRIGAVGFAVTAPEVIETSGKTAGQKFMGSVETMRFNLFKRITTAAPSEGGAILAAIVTGKRDAISESAENALRDTGLAHLLAISGLHMGMATGLIFFAVRFGLAASETLALRYPIKKWAAIAALASGFFYLILSGGGWSARRAFIMAAIMFAAILVDRRALSLRNVAIAAIVILLTTPEALFHPGFQMSFAAVTALIAGYEWFGRRASPDRNFNALAKTKRYVVGLAATDTIAALATAPYALYHFNRVAIYSLPANVAAMPLMGFWIVPAAILALLLSPFGWDGWAWRFAASGMDLVLLIAGKVASWPGAVSLTAQWPLAAMLALTVGGLWLCLSRAPWRLAGIAAIPLAMLMVSKTRHPDLFVSATGLNAGVVLRNWSDGETIAVYNTRREKFAASIWEESVGFDPLTTKPISMQSIYACDEGGCIAEIGGEGSATAAFVTDRSTLAEDCVRADLVVAFFPVSSNDWRDCEAVFIDRRSAWRRGAHSVRVKGDGAIIVKSSASVRGDRPWTGGG